MFNFLDTPYVVAAFLLIGIAVVVQVRRSSFRSRVEKNLNELLVVSRGDKELFDRYADCYKELAELRSGKQKIWLKLTVQFPQLVGLDSLRWECWRQEIKKVARDLRSPGLSGQQVEAFTKRIDGLAEKLGLTQSQYEKLLSPPTAGRHIRPGVIFYEVA